MVIGMAIRMTVFSICVTIEHTYIECYYFIADRLNAPQHHLIGTKVEYQLCKRRKRRFRTLTILRDLGILNTNTQHRKLE
jgi:hypothetical protein